MLAQEHAQAASQATRREQREQHDSRSRQEHQLHRAAPLAAIQADRVAAKCHHDQVGAYREQCRRVEDNLSRHEDVQRPLRIPPRSDRDQRYRERGDEPARIPGVRVDGPEQLRLRVEENVVDPQRAQRECQVLERESALAARVPIDLLEQHQPAERERKAGGHQGHAWHEDREPGTRDVGREQQVDRGSDPAQVQHPRKRRGHARRRGQAGQHEYPCAVAQALGNRYRVRRDFTDYRRHGQQAGPGRGHGTGDDQADALAATLPARGQQYRKHQERDSGNGVGVETQRRHGARHPATGRPFPTAPLPPSAPGWRGRRSGCGSSRSTGRTGASRARPFPWNHTGSRAAPSQ